MKQKDLALIAVVVFMSGVLSLVLSRLVIASPENNSQQVEVVQEIKADFKIPDKRYFNKESVNPTQLITIGENQNPNPFSAGSTQ